MTRAELAGALEAMSRRRSIWALVLAAALMARIGFLLSAPPRILWTDGIGYESVGWNLVTTHHFTGTYNLPPGYPLFIAAVYSVTGHHLFALRLVEVVMSTATVALVGAFAATIFSPSVGLLAAFMTAFHPVLALLPVTQYIENLLAFLAVLVFGSFALALRRPERWRWPMAGALFGLFLLCKPSVGAFLPGMALGAFVTLGRERRPRLGPACLFVAAMAVTLAPWTLRNHAVYGHWIPVSSGGGGVFWLANNPEATGSSTSAPKIPTPIWDSLATRRDVIGQDRFMYEEGWRFIRGNPWRATGLYLARLRNLWALYPRTQTHTQYTTLLADWVQGVCSAVVFLGALMGVLRAGAGGLPFLPLAAVSYSLASAAFLAVLRYRMSFEVILIWLAALGIMAWLGRGSDRRATPR